MIIEEQHSEQPHEIYDLWLQMQQESQNRNLRWQAYLFQE